LAFPLHWTKKKVMHPQYALAFSDLYAGLTHWKMWGRLGWGEIRRRYHRTTFGPFWGTMSLATLVFTLGFVWSNLFANTINNYMVYLSASAITWMLISGFVIDGCVIFTVPQNLITSVNFPYSVLVPAVVWRNLIVFLHNITIFVFVAIIWGTSISHNSLLVIPGLILVSLNGAWIGFLLGLACARYRDITPLITSLMQIAMLVTPVYWSRDSLRGGRWVQGLVDYNPFYHLLEIVREPLWGIAPASSSWLVAIVMAIVGWGIAVFAFASFRRWIPFWM
jgi:ABC-type polysaccharide/polyol phosphate export permease